MIIYKTGSTEDDYLVSIRHILVLYKAETSGKGWPHAKILINKWNMKLFIGLSIHLQITKYL